MTLDTQKVILFTSVYFLLSTPLFALPKSFVYLDQIEPQIHQDMRYAGRNNFTGKKVSGYKSGRCILTNRAASQLKKVQSEARNLGYDLQVFDCYRPQKAVQAFVRWSQDSQDIATKSQYYPNEKKSTLFDKGYIARYSGHSRGSTVDLTLVKAGAPEETVSMGTPFDFFDSKAHVFYPKLSKQQLKNRMLLRKLMTKNGFRPYHKEWWHFTLRNEPFPRSYFNFSVQ